MAGLKDRFPSFAFAASKVTPDEIDMVNQYTILHPSTSQTWFGIGTTSAATQVGIAPLVTRCDYPRNLQVQFTGGTVGGTVIIRGQDQFGGTVTESIGSGTAATGGSVAGTMVFARVGTILLTPANTNTGTTNIGFAVGTSTTSPLFGLPVKLGGTTDVKAITWDNNGTVRVHDASSAAVTRVHAFKGTAAVAATDNYVVSVRSTYNTSGATDLNTL